MLYHANSPVDSTHSGICVPLPSAAYSIPMMIYIIRQTNYYDIVGEVWIILQSTSGIKYLSRYQYPVNALL